MVVCPRFGPLYVHIHAALASVLTLKRLGVLRNTRIGVTEQVLLTSPSLLTQRASGRQGGEEIFFFF